MIMILLTIYLYVNVLKEALFLSVPKHASSLFEVQQSLTVMPKKNNQILPD